MVRILWPKASSLSLKVYGSWGYSNPLAIPVKIVLREPIEQEDVSRSQLANCRTTRSRVTSNRIVLLNLIALKCATRNFGPTVLLTMVIKATWIQILKR
ncbi:hypothetical protein ABIE28_003745 [Devosia sp. 2618]